MSDPISKIRQSNQRDLHFRVSLVEYQGIHDLAEESGESVSTILRQCIRELIHARKEVGTSVVPLRLRGRGLVLQRRP